jgi:hypothetical protein
VKTKMKKFFQENTKVVLGVGATMVAAIVVMKVADGHRMMTADYWTRPDGKSLITVTKKNGSAAVFNYKPQN